jgi:hypothetical protein
MRLEACAFEPLHYDNPYNRHCKEMIMQDKVYIM